MGLLNEFSVQLYSLREETGKDFGLVLEKISKMGYSGVEFAGYGNLEAPRMKELLEKYQLRPVGSHVGLEQLTSHLEEELEYNRVLGTETIVLPYYEMKSREDVARLAEILLTVAPKIRQAGFEFAYHNHNQEFQTDGGEYLLDILLHMVPENLLSLELDVYWAAFAGVDPYAYLEKQNNRTTLLHIKQIRDMQTKECCDLDEGILDFTRLIELGKQGKIRHFILEQESFKADPYASVLSGYNYIMQL